MRLDKLRGYGPWFAFAVPFLFLLTMAYFVFLLSVVVPLDQAAPEWFGVLVAVWVVLWALIVLAGLVVAIDLEWIEHPRTNTPMTYVALGGMAVSTLAFIAFLLDGVVDFLGNGFGFLAVAFLTFAGIGVYLVVINVVGRRAGLLGRVLPWIGIVSGAFFLIAALTVVAGIGDASGFGFFPGWALYLGWSLWLGFKLRGKAPEPQLLPRNAGEG